MGGGGGEGGEGEGAGVGGAGGGGRRAVEPPAHRFHVPVGGSQVGPGLVGPLQSQHDCAAWPGAKFHTVQSNSAQHASLQPSSDAAGLPPMSWHCRPVRLRGNEHASGVAAPAALASSSAAAAPWSNSGHIEPRFADRHRPRHACACSPRCSLL